MDLPVMPPVAPMLAKPVDSIPTGDYIFEPKWDGFRSIVFRDGDEVEIGSRNERPMTRYFPELVDAFLAQLPPRCVIDGEIVLPDWDSGRLDFEALQLRLHPAESRVRLLAAQTPAHFVAFDLLALGGTSLMEVPFGERRGALEAALAQRTRGLALEINDCEVSASVKNLSEMQVTMNAHPIHAQAAAEKSVESLGDLALMRGD